MSKHDNLGTQIVGPTLELAAKVRKVLAGHELAVHTDWGTFYVAEIRLAYDDETLGYLVPDEGEGLSFDFWTAKDAKQR